MDEASQRDNARAFVARSSMTLDEELELLDMLGLMSDEVADDE